MNTNNKTKKKTGPSETTNKKNQFISISSSSVKLHWRTIGNNTFEDTTSPSRDTPAEIRVYLTLNKRDESRRSSNDFFQVRWPFQVREIHSNVPFESQYQTIHRIARILDFLKPCCTFRMFFGQIFFYKSSRIDQNIYL